MVMLMGLEGEGNEHKLGWPRKAAWRRYSFRMDIRGQITEKPPSDEEGAGGTGYEQWGRYWRWVETEEKGIGCNRVWNRAYGKWGAHGCL